MTRFIGLVGILLLLTGAGVGCVGYILQKWSAGMRSDYHAADRDPRLTREAKTATVVMDALRRYRSEHSTFPTHAAHLTPYLPPVSAASTRHEDDFIHGWLYTTWDNGRGFELTRKLGWDPMLKYIHDDSAGYWVFDPGDGRPIKPIVLNP